MSCRQQTGESLLKKKKKRKHFAPKVAPTDSLGHHPNTQTPSHPKHPSSAHYNAPRMSGSQSIVVFVAVTQSFNYTVAAREPTLQLWVLGGCYCKGGLETGVYKATDIRGLSMDVGGRNISQVL